jgi:serine/threonine protein kinase
MADLKGVQIDRYKIQEVIGEGGMAVVYKALNTRLDSEVAVKVIRTERLAPEIAEKALKRFEREAKSLAQLTHANIVGVMDYGDFQGHPYLVMEYLRGGSLKQFLGKPMPWQDAVRLLIPIAHALEYAHKHNIIHRDVKPSNILLNESHQPMLVDFGIAKIIEEDMTIDLTGTRGAIGTPEYMSPEQGLGKLVDARTDIYALGVVFYELVTGRKPFIGDTPMETLFKHVNEPLPKPTTSVRDLPNEMEQILIKALAKKTGDRYQNMAEFVKALEGLTGSKTTAPKIEEGATREKRPEFKLPALPRRAVITMGLFALVVGLLAVFSSFLKSLPTILFPTATSSNVPMPTVSVMDLQNTAIAAAWTDIAMTQVTLSTVTPLPTFTPLSLVIAPVATSTVDPCNEPLPSPAKGAKTKVEFINESNGPVKLAFGLLSEN